MRLRAAILQFLMATLLAMPGVCAEADASRAMDSESIDRCLARMENLLQKLNELKESATNEPSRAECIDERLVKIKGLRDVTRVAANRLPTLISDEDNDGIAAQQSAIVLACARAEKLVVEAEACKSETQQRLRKRRGTGELSQAAPTKRPQPATQPPGGPERDEETCIKQDQLARLLMRVMELAPDTQTPSRGPTAELARFAIEPLQGWKPEECVTLDDLCVVVARALNLKIEAPGEPLSYYQALREEGLPVDIYFPRRVEQADPPLLLESEVRAFLSKGYAAPLPSSRRLMPE